MKLELQLEPLASPGMDAYRLLCSDHEAQATARRATTAVRRLMATLSSADLLAHAVGEAEPLAWLEGVEKAAGEAMAALHAGRDAGTAAQKADAAHRHRHDSAAMVLVGQHQGSLAHHQRSIVTARTTIDTIREVLARDGLTPQVIAQRAARLAFGVTPWQARQAREAIADAEARLGGIDAVLSAAARSGEALPEAAQAEMLALRDRLASEVAGHRQRLDVQAAEMAELDGLAQRLSMEPDSTPELLVRALSRSEHELEHAASSMVEAQAAIRALDQFLSDPLRAVDALPPAVRGQVLELSQATAGGISIKVPRLWAK